MTSRRTNERTNITHQKIPFIAGGRRGVHIPDDVSMRGLKAPFPWFGGKSRVAPVVWSRLGDVQNYIEPFAGSLAVLLGRPTPPRIETVNDVDVYLANFWRALQHAPDEVAEHADGPVNEADLHARHRWLVESAVERVAMVRKDPEFFDAKVAGWWVWGQCLWIGSGWCSKPNWEGRGHAAGSSGHDVHARRWQGGGQGGGSGVHAPSLSQQKPALNGDAGASGHGIHASAFDRKTRGLYAYMNDLATRLRRVRVCCGDWKRVLTPSVTTYMGVTGVLLDPPYAHDLREQCYSEDHDISADVRTWAIEHGDDPLFRIALCGYEDEHAKDMPDTWEKVAWKAHGGYSRSERGKKNRAQERIWFSPHCLKAEPPLFAEQAQEASA